MQYVKQQWLKCIIKHLVNRLIMCSAFIKCPYDQNIYFKNVIMWTVNNIFFIFFIILM